MYNKKNLKEKNVELNGVKSPGKSVTSNSFTAYTNGSYKDKLNNGYGLVLVDSNGNIKFSEGNAVAVIDKNLEDMSSIKSELVAIVRSVSSAYILGAKEITLVYNCNEAVDLLTCTEVKSDFSVNYRAIMNYYSQFMNITFKKNDNPNKFYKLAYDLARSTLWN